MTTEIPDSDVELVGRMAARQPEALARLYDRHRTLIFALVLRILRDRAEAEEALADVFHQAWRQAEAFDARRGSVAAWLVTLGRTRALDRVRARARRASAEADMRQGSAPGAPAASTPGEAAENSLKRKRIREALATLAEGQRSALEMAYYEGLTHSEIAARLREPLGTVKTRIRQGMIALRDRLAAEFEA